MVTAATVPPDPAGQAGCVASEPPCEETYPLLLPFLLLRWDEGTSGMGEPRARGGLR